MQKLVTYKCRLCDLLTCNKAYLYKHLSNEHGQKSAQATTKFGAPQYQFKCDDCGHRYKSIGDLRQHQRRLRKYACSLALCKYITCTKHAMEKHAEDVHGVNNAPMIHTCVLCAYGTTSIVEFKKHRKSQHPEYVGRAAVRVH